MSGLINVQKPLRHSKYIQRFGKITEKCVFLQQFFFFWQQSDVLKEFPTRAFINFS